MAAVKTEATVTPLEDGLWNVTVEGFDSEGRRVWHQGSTVVGKVAKARKFARDVGGKGTKVTVADS